MKIGRFFYNGNILYGQVEGEIVHLWEGNPFSEYTEHKESVPLSLLRVLIPVTPSKIVCVGQNYREHIRELGVPVPEKPVIFLKPPSCLVGSDEFILYPPQAARVDYEGELALIIKETMKDIPPEQALRFLLGISCFNDVTERSMSQKDPLLLTLSKGFDTFGAFGPYCVFRRIPATDSDPFRPGIPIDSGHPFRSIPTTHSGAFRPPPREA